MTNTWDGRPQNPERDGWHWVGSTEAEKPVVLIWYAPTQNWVLGAIGLPPSSLAGAKYLGPCLTPAEVEARVAAARREGIEAAIAAVDAEPEPDGEMPAKLANTDKRILVTATVRATKRGIDGRIRALLTEDGR